MTIIDKILKTPYPLTRDSIIHAFVGGSGLHGAKVEGYDDTDLYGCYIEPRHCILGLTPMQHFVWSSSDDAVKNTADDVDVTMYSLQRWGELMLKGNPAILHYLFAGFSKAGSTSVWDEFIQPMRDELITKKSAKQYLGFANSQRMRLTGEKGMGRHGQRPDLIEKYGFDTKFAMHYLRLLYECRELLTDGALTFPRPEKNVLISVRQGALTQDEVFAVGKELMEECEDLLRISTLPDEVNVNKLSYRIADAYMAHWHRCR